MSEQATVAPAGDTPASPLPVANHWIRGEEKQEYLLLKESITAAIGPQDAIEELWAEDLADIIYNRRRLKRFRNALFQSTYPAAFVNVLNLKPEFESKLRWREQDGLKLHQQCIADGTLNVDMVHAKALTIEAETFEAIDRQAEHLTKRHTLIMREIREHRMFALEAIRAIEQVGRTFEEAKVPEHPSEAGDDQRA